MTDLQWDNLLRILAGESFDTLPVGFLVDGPWFAAVRGVSLMDYLTDSRIWLEANLQAVGQYPDVMWIPGFWAEYGMISNPPSFGAKCIWPEDSFPTCDSVLRGYADIATLPKPDVRTDGLLPMIIRRMEQNRSAIEAAGHSFRFACSHGPLTIASYLLGHTEFLVGMRVEPEATAQLLDTVTDFIVDWLQLQKERFPTIDGILVLDDLMGFIGPQDFELFALPYGRRIFRAFEASVRFLHNDAFGLVTAKYLDAMRVNLFNYSFEHDVNEIRRLAGDRVTLMGNIPPRDVLGLGDCNDVRASVSQFVQRLDDRRRIILSAGGFTPSGFTSEKIQTLTSVLREG